MLEAKGTDGGGAATSEAVRTKKAMLRATPSKRRSDQASVGGVGGSAKGDVETISIVPTADAILSPDHSRAENQSGFVGSVGGSTIASVLSNPPLSSTADAILSSDQRRVVTQRTSVGSVGGSTMADLLSSSLLSTVDAILSPDHFKAENQTPSVGSVGGSTKDWVTPMDELSTADVTVSPDHASSEYQTGDVGSVGGSTMNLLSPTETMSAADDISMQIVYDQRVRRFCIKSQSRIDRSTESFIARMLGYHTGLEEKERKRIFDTASRMRRTVEKGDGEDQSTGDSHASIVLTVSRPLIIGSALARQHFDEYRGAVEKRMKANARLLPGWEFVKGVRGVGELGLAVIVGEAGDLSNYANPAKLWKRLGLAVLDGVRQGGLASSAKAEDWIAHGYSPQRRAQVWSMFDDVMFRSQWGRDPGEGEDVPTHARGPYGQVYAREKEKKLALEWTKGHAHNHARRLMTKEFIKDLWVAWRVAKVPVPKGQIACATLTQLVEAVD